MFKHLEKADKVKHPILYKFQKMSWDEILMRSVDIQVIEEFEFYREEFEMLLDEIKELHKDKPIIVEGTALLPELVESLKINKNKVIYLVPTKHFQILYYSKRLFINDILSQCENPSIAFENWMERDAQFANKVFNDANMLGMKMFRVEGELSVQEIVKKTEEHFRLTQ
jgi:hypothetical protein